MADLRCSIRISIPILIRTVNQMAELLMELDSDSNQLQ